MANAVAQAALIRSAGKPYWMRGVRGAVGVSGPLFVGIATSHVFLGVVAAIGAYLACFADDQGGAFGPRIRAMGVCVVVCGVSFLIGGLAAGWVWLAVCLVIIWTFGWALVSSTGPVPSVIAAMAATAMLVAIGLVENQSSPMESAIFLMAGGAIPVTLTAIAWPFARAAPAQRAVDNLQLAVSKVIVGCTTSSTEDNERARDAAFGNVKKARDVITRSFSPEDPTRIELLARVRAEERFLKNAAAVRFESQRLASDGEPAAGERANSAAQELREQSVSARASPVKPGEERTDEPTIRQAPFWARFRPALRFGSPAFVYAARFAIVGAIGLVGTTLLRIPHSDWITITSWRVLRTTYAATVTRLYQRVGGNIVGGSAAAVVLWIAPNLYVQATVVAVTAVLCFALRPINYGIYAIFGTWVILMLTDIGGDSSVAVAFLRIIAAIVGATIAVVGARWILPRWTSATAAKRVAAAFAADRQYADAIAQGFRGHYDIDVVTRARRAADDANGSAFSVVDQMRLEPATSLEELTATESAVRTSLELRDGLVWSAGAIPKSGRANEPVADLLEQIADELGTVQHILESGGMAASALTAADLTELRQTLAELERLSAA